MNTSEQKLGDAWVEVEYETEVDEGAAGWNQGWVRRAVVYATDVLIDGKRCGLHNFSESLIAMWEATIEVELGEVVA